MAMQNKPPQAWTSQRLSLRNQTTSKVNVFIEPPSLHCWNETYYVWCKTQMNKCSEKEMCSSNLFFLDQILLWIQNTLIHLPT